MIDQVHPWIILLALVAGFIVLVGCFLLVDALRGRRRAAAAAADEAGGGDQSRMFTFNFLDRIAVSGACRATLYCNSRENSCRFFGAGPLPPELKVECNGGRLEIALPRDCAEQNLRLEIHCSIMPSVLKLRRGAQFTVEQAAGDKFDCKVEGGSRLELTAGMLGYFSLKLGDESSARCDFTSVTKSGMHISGKSKLKCRASIVLLDLHVDGESTAEIVTVKTARIHVGGASKLDIDASETLAGDVAGGSKLNYSGAGKVSVRKSASSKVKGD